MAPFKFDTTEFISLIAASVGLIIIIFIYLFRKRANASNRLLDTTSVSLMLLIFLFIFFNRLFTNVEAIAYKPFFNLLEHLSILTASIISFIVSWLGIRGGSNS